MEKWNLGLEVFLFIFCILCVLRESYGVVKVMKLKEGKVNLSTDRLLILGSAISYILTIIIIGF